MASLLIIDDEPNVLFSLCETLRTEALEVHTAQTAREGLGLVESVRPDAVILDVRLPDMHGLDAFERIREVAPRLPVIVITAYAATETAIEATRRGAFEYLLKPVDLPHLRGVVARAVAAGSARPPGTAPDGPAGGPGDEMVGNAPAMQEVYKAIGRMAPQDVTVLLLGESGTGKELAARALHRYSRRAGGPFLAINCAAIPETLLESELFGHEKGAFTGAESRRVGKFEQAHGGTLFLDEIGDMSPATQAKVLRLLQAQGFERLGGGETITADVRVIAATNQDLEAMVARGKFRRDLLYRLNGFTIRLPALRDRKEDLPLLVDHFVGSATRQMGKGVTGVSPAVLHRLKRHDWPGNVRELSNAVRYAVLQAPGDLVTPDCLPDYLRPPPGEADEPPPAAAPGGLDVSALAAGLLRRGAGDVYRAVAQAVDRAVIGLALEHAGGNQVHAAEALGISRTTLRAKMQALGIPGERGSSPETEQ